MLTDRALVLLDLVADDTVQRSVDSWSAVGRSAPSLPKEDRVGHDQLPDWLTSPPVGTAHRLEPSVPLPPSMIAISPGGQSPV